MRISTATIDCWLDVSAPSYSDFQHHHWQVGPSPAPITDTLGNTPNYTWGLNVSGADGSGTWSTINQSKTFMNGAQAWINPQNVVTLKQTEPFMARDHDLQAIGSNMQTDHQVYELIWPDLMWDRNAGTPSSVTYRDTGAPTFQPVVILRSRKPELLLVQSMAPIPGIEPSFGGKIGRINLRHFTKGLVTPFPVHGGRGPSILLSKPRAVFPYYDHIWAPRGRTPRGSALFGPDRPGWRQSVLEGKADCPPWFTARPTTPDMCLPWAMTGRWA
jgi:hypothetical protein